MKKHLKRGRNGRRRCGLGLLSGSPAVRKQKRVSLVVIGVVQAGKIAKATRKKAELHN